MPLTWGETNRAGYGNRNRMTSLEVKGSCPDYCGELHFRGSASDRETPVITVVNGTLMAWRSGAGRRWPWGKPPRGSLPEKITL